MQPGIWLHLLHWMKIKTSKACAYYQLALDATQRRAHLLNGERTPPNDERTPLNSERTPLNGERTHSLTHSLTRSLNHSTDSHPGQLFHFVDEGVEEFEGCGDRLFL